MRNFRDLDIWKDSVQLVKRIYIITGSFPNQEKYGLISQITRCAVSIPSNIAEGCSRTSQKDFSRFLQISIGSSFELETQIEIAKEIGLINPDAYSEIIQNLNSIQKRIQSLKKYVDSKSDTNTQNPKPNTQE
jgi:four helix bundle protein